jgi:hypothetical protein
MAQETINNGETGLSIRTKLNNMFGELYRSASTILAGLVRLSTTAEAVTGTDETTAVTPAGLQAGIDATISSATVVNFNEDDVDVSDVLTVSYADQGTAVLGLHFFDSSGLPVSPPTILTLSSSEFTADVTGWVIGSENWTVMVNTGGKGVPGDGGGTSDHGSLGGLSDDDHTQYLNTTRGDARYAVIAHAHTGVYQPLASNLTTYAAITPSVNVQSLMSAADYAAITTLLGAATKVGTPVDTQVGVWAGDGPLGGSSALTFDGTILTTNRLHVGDGTSAFPTITFASESNTGFYGYNVGEIGVTIGGTTQILFTDGTIEPLTDSDVDLGTTDKRFKKGWFDDLDVTNVVMAVSSPFIAETTDRVITSADFGKTIVVDSASIETMTFPSMGAADDGKGFNIVPVGSAVVQADASDSDTLINETETSVRMDTRYENYGWLYYHAKTMWLLKSVGDWSSTP